MSDDRDIPRIALVGATSLLGEELREQLADAGYPGEAVALLDLEDAAGLLTEYGEEARVVMDTAEEDLGGHDLVCFCGDPELTRAHLRRAAESGLVLDCTAATADREDVSLWLPASGEPPKLVAGTPVTLPGDVVLLLAPALVALGEAGAGVSITAFLPASEQGSGGLDELARQSTAVLNLVDVPDDVFGRQLAFDLWRAPVGEDGTDDAAAAAVGQLGRLGLPVPALSVFRAPLFHAMSAIAHLPGGDAADLEERLEPIVASVDDHDEEPLADSPLRVTGRGGLHLGGAWADPERGAWLWLVMDNLKARAAASVSAVEALAGRPGRRTV